jgi:methyl-accepting chemotaxis protein
MKLRRKRYLIDKKLQLRLLVYNIIYFLIIVSVIGVGLFLPLVIELSDGNLDIMQQGVVADKILYLHSRLGPVLLVIFLVFGVHSLLVSHKIAGPLYRFRATFQQVAEGDLSKVIGIRKGDFLLNEQAKIEEMISALRAKLSIVKREQAVIERVVNQLGQESAQSGDLKRSIAALEECNSRLKKELEYFRLTDMDVVNVRDAGKIFNPDDQGK